MPKWIVIPLAKGHAKAIFAKLFDGQPKRGIERENGAGVGASISWPNTIAI